MSAEQPFTTLHSQRLFLLTDGRRDALARLDDGLGTREPFVLLTGVPGIGKTALVQEAVARWGTRVAAATVTNPALSRNELIEEICRRFGAAPPPGATKPQLLAALEGVLSEIADRDQIAVLVIEDAHDLTAELLEELRLVANAQVQAGRRLEIVLVGLPALDTTLSHPELAALRQRVAVHVRLGPLTQRETRNYLHHRMEATGQDGPRQFPRKACSEIQHRTGGVPRAINTLAAEALRRARETGSGVVTPDLVRAAASVVASALTAVPTPAPAEHGAAEDPIAPTDSTVTAPAPLDAPVASDSTTTAEATPAPPSTPDPPASDAPAAVDDLPTMRPPVERSNDPRAKDWVRRFIGDDGPPRIGARIAWDASAVGYADEFGEGTEARASELDRVVEPLEPPTPPAPPKPRKKKPEHSGRTAPTQRWLTVEESAPSEAPGLAPAAAPLPRAANASQKWSPIHTAIVVIVVIVALAVLILPRAHRATPRPDAAKTAAELPATKTIDAASVPTSPQVEITPIQDRDVDTSPSESNNSTPSVSRVAGAPPGAAATTPSTVPEELTVAADQVDSTAARKYALDVASFIDQVRAREERDRLAELTQLTGWVTSSTTGYHIMLGTFSTRQRAETAANILLERGVLWQARVVELKQRR